MSVHLALLHDETVKKKFLAMINNHQNSFTLKYYFYFQVPHEQAQEEEIKET